MAEVWFDELAEFLRIPSVSADPAHAPDVARAVKALAVADVPVLEVRSSAELEELFRPGSPA